MKMENKSLYQILEEVEALLSYRILSLDLNEINSQTQRQALESSRQDIKEQRLGLPVPCITMKPLEGSKNVEAQWNRLDTLDKRISKLDKRISKLEKLHESDLR